MRFLRIALCLAFSFSLTMLVHAQATDPAIVKTENGLVRGVVANGVISWKGIPYAKPPIGELRWRVPQSVQAWSEVKDATKFGPACMQTDDIPKSEDCLTLNVWRPAAAAEHPLPVMVWIYGGALVHGSTAMYPLDAIAAQGVVAVSMNYRMGRFGFFAHPALAAEAPNDVRGNYGYMDQLAALEWVKRNIAAFGGDPAQVTIFGESAGGGSVLVHIVSPMSRGRFQRAILQSPCAPCERAGVLPASDLAKAEKIAVDWSGSVGVTGNDAAALRQLRALSAEKLLEGVSSKETLAALFAGTTPPGMSMAIIDGRFLPLTPEDALHSGQVAMIPTMIGSNDRDLPSGSAKSKDELFAVFGPAAEQAREAYDPLGNQTLDELKQQVFADRTFSEPTRYFAREMTRAGQPVWLYRFAYVSEAQRGTDMGVLHAFEIPFTLNIPAAMVKDKVTATDKIMADVTSGYWVQFAKTGDPNGASRPEWPRYDPSMDRILHFTNSGVIVGTDPWKARIDLWEAVWAREAAGSGQKQTMSGGSLAGTSWQLVKFEGGDGTTLVPEDKSKYTVAFADDGGVSVRIDCNRGHGTWKSPGPGQLQFGPMALTRAMCPAAPLNDRFPRDWDQVRSYVLKDGHIFLSLVADGGIYEFEPAGEKP